MIIVRTPLRISFLGGGSDFPGFYDEHGGAVLTTAINKYIYVILKERFDDDIYVNYSKKEIVKEVGQVQHELVREAMSITGVDLGIEITTLADVPSTGTGLGSSSSITVGLLQGLYTYRGKTVLPEDLAEQACGIEIERCGKPIGKQDQYIAAFGGMGLLEFRTRKEREEGKEEVAMIPTDMPLISRPDFSRNLMMFFTNITRSSSSVLTEQKARIGDNTDGLVRLRELAIEGFEALGEGNFDRIGTLMDRGWEIKRELASGVSSPFIDDLYVKAREAGALGGKIAGAGGGGFLLLYCPLEKQGRVRDVLRELREIPLGCERDGSKIILNIRE